MKILTVDVVVNKNIHEVWNHFTNPDSITKWNHASDDWHCPKATIELRIGGKFSYIMSAVDGTSSFDFNGTFISVEKYKNIQYEIQGGRKVNVTFEKISEDSTKVTEDFEMESENSEERQRFGWQCILNNFKNHCEQNG